MAVGEVVVDREPPLAGLGVEPDGFVLPAGEHDRGSETLVDAVEVGVGERAAEWQLLAALDGDEHEAHCLVPDPPSLRVFPALRRNAIARPSR